jgi:hypothetical protein
MYDIGEKPGVGRYCCTSCGWSVNLDDGSDRLPPVWQLRQGAADEVQQLLTSDIGIRAGRRPVSRCEHGKPADRCVYPPR